MDFKQLEAFAYVIQLKSFSKAAERLYLTQPTVSAHLNKLEKELGIQLVVRTPKEAYPTGAGSILYEYALDMLSLRESAVTACKSHQATIAGDIQIAASTIPNQYVLPRMMSEFRLKYPEVVFNVLASDSIGVISSIVQGKAELGMVGTKLENSKCTYCHFADDNLVVITPNTEPYTRIPSEGFPLDELAQHPFIAREPGSGTRKEAEKFLEARGIPPSSLRIVAQMDNPDAIKNSVSQGLGISIVSQLSAADYEQFGLVRSFHLGGESVTRRLYFVHHKRRPLSPVAVAFTRFTIEQYAISSVKAADR